MIPKLNLKRYYRLFFSKRNIIFFGKKEHKLVNKTALYYYGYRKSRIAEDKSRRKKRQEREILLEDESDGKWDSGRENSGWMTGSSVVRRTTWVSGCRNTSWKTLYRKTKYSHTNTVKYKVHGKTKYSRKNWVKKNSWQFAVNIVCKLNVFNWVSIWKSSPQ